MSKAPNGKSLELRTNANDENGKAANRGRLYFVKGLLGADVNGFVRNKLFLGENFVYIRSAMFR